MHGCPTDLLRQPGRGLRWPGHHVRACRRLLHGRRVHGYGARVLFQPGRNVRRSGNLLRRLQRQRRARTVRVECDTRVRRLLQRGGRVHHRHRMFVPGFVFWCGHRLPSRDHVSIRPSVIGAARPLIEVGEKRY